MAQQQAMFFDVISSMKRATARRDDASESDDSITATTNRGNKLKRKAKHVREGRLAQADGPRVYKRRLVYNGYSRNVISKNAARVDPDGDLIEDEDNSDPELSPAEDDPYSEVKLERLLMPLTNAADLDKHPSLSVTYTSKVLEEMVQDAQDMVHREEHALWRVKQILIEFRGDDGWAPCGMFEAGSDPLLLQNPQQNASTAHSVDLEDAKTVEDGTAWEATSQGQLSIGPHAKPDITSGQPHEGDALLSSIAKDWGAHSESMPKTALGEASGSMHVEAMPQETLSSAREQNAPADVSETFSNQQHTTDRRPDTVIENHSPVPQPTSAQNGHVDKVESTSGVAAGQNHRTETFTHEANGDLGGDQNETSKDRGETSDGDIDGTQAHRMTTRARAQANPDSLSQTSQHPDADSLLSVHPFFMAPLDTLPFRAQGLAAPLSDDIRLVLSAYAQRQEEVVRQCSALLSGLRRALHLKQAVWNWCRNEGHVGEMSDGEDWIDMEQWGLDEPLKKGEEVEDEEVAVGLTKKTRNRRAAA